ncbi:SDR family oxidoreductase [Bailinhaonella thermotolerans]|uniref:SDR family oxidoreductase n=1 Tax=Bailinhaonella thermotolerans TaxID=1070861 RepID=A0A3A4AUF5_9ACTN|nr:SDR family oxidoreductase [Bailinhaonella thermotolerans]RJL31925.1 SDR family oxidoreductase [Bailinhaonella thermotolerans]
MDLRLNGKTVLITGASRGIGLAVARRLAAEGMRVAGAARTITPELEEVADVAIAADLATPDGARALVDAALAALGGIDVLVNNVGGGDVGAEAIGGFLSVSDEVWEGSFAVNFFSAVRVARAALPGLVERRGAIVNVSSNAARLPHAGPVHYTTAKSALTALGKALAEEFGPQGVRVNTVSPGPVRTAMWESEDGYGAELSRAMNVPREHLVAGLPASMGMLTGRLVEPDEVAGLVAVLASPVSASVVGADYVVDGGAIKTA